ncbi:unnamed protein product [Vicia faba]|uniref:Uncharacterized protein n=1 Tax=Vicia faba TaxID=3906 RepID=A0AAV0ZEN6_VICFA|nr:unnamed protein product [Vicia faba]
MIFSRKHVSVIVLLLIVFLAITWNLTLVSASSGGVMGGSFFDSDSSSSESYTTESDSEYEEDGGRGPMVFFMIFVFGVFLVGFCSNKDANGNTISVFKLQVGMSGEAGCSIQRDLTRIAQAANTSSREGVSYLLKDTIQTLDQHHGYFTAGYSSVEHKQSKEDGEKCYNQLSNEERSKFDEETLVNVNNNNMTIRRSRSYDEYAMLDSEETEKFEKEKLLSGPDNKYIVVTVLVAAKGAHKLPNINRAEDLKEVLQKLKSLISSKYLFAGEVLWTPQEEDDTLSDRQLLKDYPQLAKSMNIFLVKKHE